MKLTWLGGFSWRFSCWTYAITHLHRFSRRKSNSHAKIPVKSQRRLCSELRDCLYKMFQGSKTLTKLSCLWKQWLKTHKWIKQDILLWMLLWRPQTFFSSFYKARQNLRADMYTTETGIAQTSSLRFRAIDLMKMKITVVSKIYEKNNPK